MMKVRQLLVLSIAILLSACAGNKKETPLTEEEVLAVIGKFDNGWRNKKKDLVDSVLSKRYVYFTQSGHTFGRNQLVETAGSDIYSLQTMERESFDIQLEGNTAVVNTVWSGKGAYHGENFNDRQRCSITIVKHDGKVKILAEHCTPIK